MNGLHFLMILGLMAVAGFGVGVAYFYGLWLTINRLPVQRRWGFLMVVSFLGRMSLVAVVFYLLMADDWRRLMALFAGFMLARFVMLRRMGPAPAEKGATR